MGTDCENHPLEFCPALHATVARVSRDKEHSSGDRTAQSPSSNNRVGLQHFNLVYIQARWPLWELLLSLVTSGQTLMSVAGAPLPSFHLQTKSQLKSVCSFDPEVKRAPELMKTDKMEGWRPLGRTRNQV